ncbi:phosphonate C-P lyase system protein PhnH, partial [Shinella sp.]
MTLDTLAFAGGFEEPVFEAQAVFRTLMDCMARPGTI